MTYWALGMLSMPMEPTIFLTEAAAARLHAIDSTACRLTTRH